MTNSKETESMLLPKYIPPKRRGYDSPSLLREDTMLRIHSLAHEIHEDLTRLEKLKQTIRELERLKRRYRGK